VHAGDTLMEIEQSDYATATSHAEAALESARANLVNARAESGRRQRLSDLAVSAEEQQRFRTQADIAQANHDRAQADLTQARLNLQRTRIISPVSGYITNLTTQVGDYATAGHRVLTVVNAESFWVEGYFEETQLGAIHLGDPATISLMGYHELVRGHVDGISRGIEVANAQSDESGLQTVNPVYTWIRLAQRVPVRIAIDQVPKGVTLVAGQTATVQIEQGDGHRASVERVAPAAGASPPAGAAR
jgi:RND family efflux transporter MFP subunit